MECTLCPRNCKIDREIQKGYCGNNNKIALAKAMVHLWEEPCISGKNGSGAIFFSGCPLKCCFCQNYKISHENYGKEITINRLSEIFLELQEKGVNNINLVTAVQFVPQIILAIDMVKDKIKIPFVYNTSGYESEETIDMLNGYIDIYLPDIKYKSKIASRRYSKAENYFDVATKAVKKMYSQVGKSEYTKDGIMKKGMIIRHMMLPNLVADTKAILRWIYENIPNDEVPISIMSQYTPFYKSCDYKEINRKIKPKEYNKIVNYAYELGLTNGYMQELSSAKEEYTPNFNLQGI